MQGGASQEVQSLVFCQFNRREGIAAKGLAQGKVGLGNQVAALDRSYGHSAADCAQGGFEETHIGLCLPGRGFENGAGRCGDFV